MKIELVTVDGIFFDNGDKIEDYHVADCCENNYADFEQLDDIGRNTTFESPLTFEAVEGSGFRFGNPGKMFFIPCYSEQNGYYSSDIDILYNNKKVLNFECEERFY